MPAKQQKKRQHGVIVKRAKVEAVEHGRGPEQNNRAVRDVADHIIVAVKFRKVGVAHPPAANHPNNKSQQQNQPNVVFF